MSVLNKSLGIQSYCFRNFLKNEDVAKKLKECNVNAVELCGVHANFFKPELFDSYIQPYRKAGISIVSIGVNTFTDDAVATRNYFEFAKQAGAKVLSIMFDPDSSPASWRVAEKLADEYDVLLGIHNHGGHNWLGSSEMLAHVFKNTSERIGLCLDTAWALDAGENLEKMITQFHERLYGLHLKDFTFDRAGEPADVVVGTGNIDLPKLIAQLQHLPKLGFAVVEYEADPENPVPALTTCIDAIRAAAA